MRNQLCTLALAGLVSLGLSATAFAQDNSAPPPQDQSSGMHEHHRGGMDPDAQLKHMTRQLDLSADQQSQIKPILESRQQQMQQLWQNQSMSRDERHQKMQAIQQDSSQKIEAVLNDSQKQKYESMQERMQQRRMRHQQQDQAPSQDSAPPAPQQ
jgi:periplasmic protein CpxP/Spy